MEQYLILARSVTYAQRMQKALGQAGIRCQISRAPRDVTDLGCAYVVRLDFRDLAPALVTLHKEGLDPIRIFLEQHGEYREVMST
ncbi:MAG: DUF3343 domain-containing protein [Oscillospiraceae bacterium]|nr:DUF3343 domain-containing protein [Oscillospiraceae bacterium]